jgi:hypothetical protein
MKGWKASSFEVPWLLKKTTNLGGSKHDKNKEEWEKIRTFAFSVPLCAPLPPYFLSLLPYQARSDLPSTLADGPKKARVA